MDVTHLCRCCLRRSPDKDLAGRYEHKGKTEIYAQMLQECYNIPPLLSGLGTPGICLVCVDRLRDAHDFKRQVQWSQAELQEWLQGEFSNKGDAEDHRDIYSPSRPTDERRSRSRVPSRSRSRSRLRESRGQSGSPPKKFASLQRKRPRSRPRSQPRRSRVTTTSRRRRSPASSRSKVSTVPSRSKASRHPHDSRRRSNSRSSRKRRRSRSHTTRKASRRSHSPASRRSRSQASRRSRSTSSGQGSSGAPSEASHRSPSRESPHAPILQPEKLNESEPCVKPGDTMITADSDSNPLKFLDTVPEFDPSNRQQTMTMWIRKLNVCASINGWSERQLVYNALPKLKGLAQMWYEGLPSVLFSWTEWQAKLLAAFPSKENYGQMLSDMVSRRARPGDSLEDYYYDKVALINRVSEPITGRLAVECVLHGIDDASIRSGAESAQFCDLDNLLAYLRNVQSVSDCKVNIVTEEILKEINTQVTQTTISVANIPLKCFNCNQEGHESSQCPMSVKICSICRMIGHGAGHEQCYAKLQNSENSVMESVSFIPTVTRSETCQKCKLEGHKSSQCPLGFRKRTKCGKVGHLAEQCYDDMICGFCKKAGHEAKHCRKNKCTKCKKMGHVAEHCFQKTRLGGVIKCFICEKSGHKAEQCFAKTQNNSSEDLPEQGTGGIKTCYKCRNKGHLAEQCTMSVKKCYICQQVGHLSKQCPKKKRNSKALKKDESLDSSIDSTNEGKREKCINCKQDGHLLPQCTLPIKKCTKCQNVGHEAEQCSGNLLEVKDESFENCSDNTAESKSIVCFKCEQEGHFANKCPLRVKKGTLCLQKGHEAEAAQCLANTQNKSSIKSSEDKIIRCFNCEQEGHKIFTCPLPVKTCTICLKKGHEAEQCNSSEIY